VAGTGPAASDRWKAAVSVREDRALERELTDRLRPESARRPIGVTDLVSLRRAYFRSVAPGVTVPAGRQARIDRGRALHRWLGVRLATEGLLEARVRREEFVGRIDLLTDLPVELKTSASLVDPARLPSERPDHVEQLGMYSALVGSAAGRLVTVVADAEELSGVQAVDIPFRSTANLLAEMRRRAELLRAAWADGRPEGLPRCPWFGRGCEFEEAGVCGCSGEEAPTSPAILAEAGTPTPREAIAERYRDVVAVSWPPEGPGNVARFRDLLYPRRAYFDRTVPLAAVAPAPPVPPPSVSFGADLYGRLIDALEGGPAGEMARLPPLTAEPEEEVAGFRGRPVLVKTSRAATRTGEGNLLTRAPQYALELGLRCATTGATSGRVVLGFERAERDPDRIRVFDIEYSSLTAFSRLVRERSRALSVALRDRRPAPLEPCPAWMVPDCPYRADCGCGADRPRVTR